MLTIRYIATVVGGFLDVSDSQASCFTLHRNVTIIVTLHFISLVGRYIHCTFLILITFMLVAVGSFTYLQVRALETNVLSAVRSV